MPNFQVTYGQPEGPDERALMREHFTERSDGWDCKKCAAFVNGRPLSGPEKHLAWHEAIGG